MGHPGFGKAYSCDRRSERCLLCGRQVLIKSSGVFAAHRARENHRGLCANSGKPSGRDDVRGSSFRSKRTLVAVALVLSGVSRAEAVRRTGATLAAVSRALKVHRAADGTQERPVPFGRER